MPCVSTCLEGDIEDGTCFDLQRVRGIPMWTLFTRGMDPTSFMTQIMACGSTCRRECQRNVHSASANPFGVGTHPCSLSPAEQVLGIDLEEAQTFLRISLDDAAVTYDTQELSGRAAIPPGNHSIRVQLLQTGRVLFQKVGRPGHRAWHTLPSFRQ